MSCKDLTHRRPTPCECERVAALVAARWDGSGLRAQLSSAHAAEVVPARGRAGLGGDLCERGFEFPRAGGHTLVGAVSAPVETGSAAVHALLGFSIAPGEREADDVPVGAASGRRRVHRQRVPLPEAAG